MHDVVEPQVLEALGRAAEAPPAAQLTHYQTGADPALLADLARYVGAPGPENVLAAAGSDEVLRAVIDTCGLRGHRKLVMGVPGYAHFEHYARLRGLELVTYPIGLGTAPRHHRAALRYYAPHLAEGCLVYLCSPNNPTGDLWSEDAVAALAADFPASLFVVDEAYVEFADPARLADDAAGDAAALNSLSVARLAARVRNVVVTRTMSKAFGLAALRVGYAVAHAAMVEALTVAVSPKALSPAAAPVARAALASLGHYRRAAARTAEAQAAAVAGLRGAGWRVVPTPGNFYLVYAGAGGSAAACAALARLGVLARDRGDNPGLEGFIRLTAGTSEDTAAVLAAFRALDPPAAPPPQDLYACKGVVAQVKTLVRSTLAVLADAGVEAFAQGGTLLGMVRHSPGGMVPWDDDADLAYVVPGGPEAYACDPLADLVGAFRAAGLTLQRNRTGAYWQVGTNPPGWLISPVHVDVFSYRLRPGRGGAPEYVLDDERFRDEDPLSPQAHCNTRYAPGELYPLDRTRRFYDLAVPVPAAAEEALWRALGGGFMTRARARAGDRPAVEFDLLDLAPA